MAAAKAGLGLDLRLAYFWSGSDVLAKYARIGYPQVRSPRQRFPTMHVGMRSMQGSPHRPGQLPQHTPTGVLFFLSFSTPQIIGYSTISSPIGLDDNANGLALTEQACAAPAACARRSFVDPHLRSDRLAGTRSRRELASLPLTQIGNDRTPWLRAQSTEGAPPQGLA